MGRKSTGAVPLRHPAGASAPGLDPICGRCGESGHDRTAPHCAFCGTLLGRTTHPDTAEQCEDRFNKGLAVAAGPAVAAILASLAGPTSPPAPPEAANVDPGALLTPKQAARDLGMGWTKFKDDVQATLPYVLIPNTGKGERKHKRYERKVLEAWRRDHTVGGSSDFPKGAGDARTLSGSGTMGSASNGARAEAIRQKLLSKPRASTRT
jgi:hypothetical protein